MGQRLCLGRTLIHDPPVLILDEPAAGLDPKARIEFKHLIRLLAEEGKTIFISSHILTELGEMCDSLLFIDNGRIVHQGSAESLTRGEDESGLTVAVEIAGEIAAAEQWITMQPGISLLESRKEGCLIRFDDDEPAFLTATLKRMLNEGLPVIGFRREERKLEDAFVALINKLEGPGALPELVSEKETKPEENQPAPAIEK
jgi:ABC-2 type transport system ATP-binding protein